MTKLSFLSQTVLAFIIAGASLFNSTSIRAYTLSYLKAQDITLKLNSPKANLIAESWWQKQIDLTQDMSYDACLFGDSISSSLGNTLGTHTFNFAMGGMTTSSLVDQLKALTSANVKCQIAIIAMGTNDASSSITNEELIKNLKTSISLVQGMGATKIFLIPAFYSTVEASRKPPLAGSISRVEEINALIRQVAATEKVVLFEQDIQPLYRGQALRKNLTTDGVHLNSDGQNIYRQALLKILSLSAKAGAIDSQP